MDLFSSFQISQFLLKLVVCPTGDPVHLLYHKFTGGAVVVQSLSHVRLCDPMDCSMPASLSFTISCSLLRLMSIESVILSNHPILCHPLSLLPSIFLRIRVFSNESVLCIKWPKYWSFSFSISPSSLYSRLISFRIDWFDKFTSA